MWEPVSREDAQSGRPASQTGHAPAAESPPLCSPAPLPAAPGHAPACEADLTSPTTLPQLPAVCNVTPPRALQAPPQVPGPAPSSCMRENPASLCLSLVFRRAGPLHHCKLLSGCTVCKLVSFGAQCGALPGESGSPELRKTAAALSCPRGSFLSPGPLPLLYRL